MFPSYTKSKIIELLNDKNTLVDVFSTIDSTNVFLHKNKEIIPHLVIAEMQTMGKGRGRRQFFSPPNCGIYMSYLFNPIVLPKDFYCITPICAIAVMEVIYEVLGVQCSIKWVNDLYLNNKKVCGILTERADDYVIVGIGINLIPPKDGYPEDLSIAGSVLSKVIELDFIREKIIAQIINNLSILLLQFSNGQKSIIKNCYEKNLMVIGKEVTLSSGTDNGISQTVKVIGIDNKFRLRVLNNQNKELLLESGEIMIKL